MTHRYLTQFLFTTLLLTAMLAPVLAEDVYTYASPSRDGIGKFYQGREISHVMGHLGAGWLERPRRQREERTDLLLKNLPVKSESVVADIGAGTGYFAFRLAPRVKQVLAVDIQPEMLAIMDRRIEETGLNNVVTMQGSEVDANLPENSVDVMYLVDAYHEFSHPFEMGQGMVRALKPDGRLVLIEYRAEDPRVPIKRLHKMSEAQVIKEMRVLGLRLEANEGFLPQQHFLIFTKEDITVNGPATD